MSHPRFHIGQPVVVVDKPTPEESIAAIRYGFTLPTKGPIYHIRSVVAPFKPGEEWEYTLKEILNPNWPYAPHDANEVAFLESIFAPVEEMSNELLAELKEVLEPVFI